MDKSSGIGASSLIVAKNEDSTFYINVYMAGGKETGPSLICFESVAKTLGPGTHLIVNKFSGVKKLIINVNDKIKMVDNLDEIDKCEQWIGDELLGDGDDTDFILGEYRANAIIGQDAVYLCAPKLD